MNNKGFTLIELLAVIAILGILVLLAAPKFVGYTEHAKLAQIKNDSKAHETALNIEMTNNPNYIDYMVQNWNPADYTELTEASNQGLLYDETGKTTFEKICENSKDIEKDVREGAYFLTLNNNSKNECFEIPENYTNTKLPGKFLANKGGEVVYIHNVNVRQSNPNDPNCSEQPFNSNPESDFLGKFVSKEEMLEFLEFELAKGTLDQDTFDRMIYDLEDMFFIYDYIGTSTDVVIPEKIQCGAIKIIVGDSFNNKGLTSIYIPNSVVDINANAFSENLIEELVLPSELINIYSEAFYGNPLKTITFGNKIELIDDYAFSHTKLTEIRLPKSLKYINEYAFSMNPRLKKIYSYSDLNLDHKFHTRAEVIYIK